MNCTLSNYKAECEKRYTSGFTFRDAVSNFSGFDERKEDFTAWARHYRKDPLLQTGKKYGNPDGTLSNLCWVMQAILEPDKSRLSPCLDFEEHYQKVFLKRGLVIYMTLLLKDLEEEAKPKADERQLDLC